MAIWLIFLVCSLNVSGDSIRYSGEFLSGPHTGHECCPHMSCGDFSEVYIKLCNLSLQGFEKEAVLIFSVCKSEMWENNWKC